MSFERFLTTPVSVLTADVATDAYGDEVLDWTSPASRDTFGWLFQRSSTEATDGRDAVSTAAQLFLAADDPIGPADRVVTPSGTWEVIGTPAVRPTPRGPHHVEVELSIVTDLGGN